MISYPFCVLDRPFMIWGEDIARDNATFLTRIDAGLYYRTAHGLIGSVQESAGESSADAEAESGDDQARKDVSSLSRLLWHHGIETLVMMLGAYIQAPGAVHGYIPKCKTEDAAEMARLLLREERPRYHRLSDMPFTILNLLEGIHRCAAWTGRERMTDRLARALKGMLLAFTTEHHRWEYNSIKHGLRASHGRFAIAFGIQEAPGIPAPREAMQTIGYSEDASFFDVATPLRNATRQQSKVHFCLEKVSVAWSFDKVLGDLQLLSILLHNLVSALRITAGAKPSEVSFHKIAGEDDAFWDRYFSLHAGNVPHATMFAEIDARELDLPTAKQIQASYRIHTGKT